MGLCCGGSSKDNKIDPLIMQAKALGPPLYDDIEGGGQVLDFEYYIKIIKLQIKWFARDFQKQKDLLAYQRRTHLNDEVLYK